MAKTTLEELETLAQAYEEAYYTGRQEVGLFATKAVNDTDVLLYSVKSTLNLYGTQLSENNPDISNRNGAFYSEATMVSEGKKKNYKVVAGIEIPDTAFTKYIEQCFSCDGRIRFEFELMPDGAFFFQLTNILDEIEKSIGALIDSFTPNSDLLKDLCAFLNMLNNIACPQDLLNLALALSLLVNQKMSYLLKIRINWWGLFGFAIKWFLETLSALIEQLANMLAAPLECLLAALTSALQTLRSIDKAFQTVTDPSDPSSRPIVDIRAGKVILNFENNDMFGGNSFTTEANTIYDLKLPEQIIALTKTVIAYIEALKKKILEGLESLTMIVRNNKILEIKAMLEIKFLTNIIALLIYIGSLDDIRDLCKEDTSKKKVEEIINKMTNSKDATVTPENNGKSFAISYTDVSGVKQVVSMPSCLVAKQEADAAKMNLSKLLEEFKYEG